MPRPALGDAPMSNAERQRRYRAQYVAMQDALRRIEEEAASLREARQIAAETRNADQPQDR